MRNSIRKIRSVAIELLNRLGISSAQSIDVERIAQELNATIDSKPLGEISGVLLRREGQIIIGVNSTHHDKRRRFTIAHEIGHLLLHNHNSLYVDKIFPVRLRDATSSEASDRDEIEANAFAAELLMPLFMLENEPELQRQVIDYEKGDIIDTLADRYKVSSQAMTFRLINLGLIAN